MNKPSKQRPFASRTQLACAIVFGLACAGVGRADAVAQVPDHGAASSANVEQRLRDELRVVMAGLIENGAFGNQSPQQIALAVDTPAQRVSDLGLLVDSAQHDRDGVHVLGVTPGSRAEHIGLRAGDVVVALNGNGLANNANAAADLRRSIDSLPDGSTLTFAVQRDGRAQTVSGLLSSTYVPAMRLLVGEGNAPRGIQIASNGNVAAGSRLPAESHGCGRVSDFDVAPRQQQLHAATIISIDGVTPGPSGSKAYRVAAGPHTLKVAERIENRYLSFSDRMRNAGLQSDRYKTLEVDVAPDTTTLIAARLNEDKRNEPAHGAYWDPVAWKQTVEACQ